MNGTTAHSFVQAHGDELEAFGALARLFGDQTVLLVDTYDTPRGIERAVRVAKELAAGGRRLHGIRIDSGDLDTLARLARRRLDEEGLEQVQIILSGGLGEHMVGALIEGGTPVDGFAVGSDMAVSADAPVLDSVYKLVEFEGRPVRKLSPGKQTWPGAKQVWRRPGWSGDVLGLAAEPAGPEEAEPLLVEVFAAGRRTPAGRVSSAQSRARFESQLACLPLAHKDLRAPAPYAVRPSEALWAVTRSLELDRAASRSAGPVACGWVAARP